MIYVMQDDGSFLTIGRADGGNDEVAIEGFVGKANIVEEDIEACDSVVHIIDRILIPEEVSLQIS